MENVSGTGSIPVSDDPEFHSISEAFERRFFADDEQVRFEVTLMRETWDQIRAMMTEYDWQPNEGLIILLATGMAYLRGERALTVSDGGAGYSAADLKKLLERGITIESKYAAIRNFAFSIMRDHRALEIKFDPMERQYHIYRNQVTRLRAENDSLQAENERLKRAVLSTDALSASQPTRAAKSGHSSLWQRIKSLLRGES